RLTIAATLALLRKPEFTKAAYALLRELAAFGAHNQDQAAREAFANERVQPFIAHWGVPPPQAPDLVDPDPRRRVVDALASGRWGIVGVFAWTTEREIQAHARKIRRAVAKQHRDAETVQRAQLARWLEDCGFGRAEIAMAVWGRTTGLRRPSRAKAIQRISEEDERRQLAELQAQGLSRRAAENRLLCRARGSEAAAVAAVRMAEIRYVRALEALNRDLSAPRAAEPRAHALTLLFRAVADGDDADVRRHAAAVRQAFLGN